MAEKELVVLAEIRRVFTEQLEWEGGPVEPSQHLLKDLQLDSMGLTVLAVELENRFRIRLSPEDSAQVSTVGDLARLVAARASQEGTLR